MNQLIIGQSDQSITMTSREIASLVNSRHSDVCRTIDRLMASGTISGYAPTAYTHTQNGQQYAEYHIGKRDSYVIVAQLSPEFTARLVDRWQELELEVSPKFAIPQSFAEALRLAADQQEVIQKQAAELAIAAPKVDFVDRYVSASSGSKKFREVARLLKIKENAFWDFLESERIMYRLRKKQTPYACHIDAGRFEVTTGVNEAGHAYNTVLFTPKGITWVAGEWAKYQVEKQSKAEAKSLLSVSDLLS